VTPAAAPAPVATAPAAKPVIVPATVGAHFGILGAKKTLAKATVKHSTRPAHVLGAQAVKRVAAPAHAVVAAAHFTG